MADLRVDVVVVGAGVMGAMCAWELASRGVSVAILERSQPGHLQGASHGGSRIFRTICVEGTAYAELARCSRERLRELEHASGVLLVEATGGLVIGEMGDPQFERARAVAATAGVTHDVLDETELRGRFPQHGDVAGSTALLEPTAGVMNPELVVGTALAAAVRCGAQLIDDTAVSGLKQAAGGVVVLTERGDLQADTVVVAAGAWTPRLLPDSDLQLTARRSNHTWYQPAEANGYGPDNFPVFMRFTPGLSGWGVPAVDARGVKVGLWGDGVAKRLGVDPDNNWQHSPGPDETEPVDKLVARALPGLVPRAAYAEPCLDGRTPDAGFLIGRDKSQSRVVVCAGFSGHGFKHCGAVALAVAGLTIDGRSPVDITPFELGRFT